jgi:hypothetical protein
VKALDLLGNAGPATSRNFTVDTTPPSLHFDSGPSGKVTTPDATFAFSATGKAVGFRCSLDGATFAGCAPPVALNGLADGSHSFAVKAVDAVGNWSAPLVRAWQISTGSADPTPPAVTIDSGPTGPVAVTTPSFTFSSEPGATFECRLDGGSFAACISPFTTPQLADGGHTFYVRATDTAGNTSTAISQAFTVDTIAPVASFTSGPTGTISGSSASFDFDATGHATGFECSLDGADFAACASPASVDALADGNHTFRVRAHDAAGNLSDVVSRTFAVDTTPADTTPPVVTVDSGPSGPIANAAPSFGFSSEPGATFQCRLDGGSFAACASPFTTPQLAEGAHTFYVRATDVAGNTSAPVSQAFTVDLTAPIASFTSGPSGTIATSSATFAFTATGHAVVYQCSLDGASFAACTSPATVSDLQDGPHAFRVRALDAAGNISAPVTRVFTASAAVDTTPPVVTIDSGPSGPVPNATPSFTFSSEPGATFECRLDGGSFAPCTSPFGTPTLADGGHTFYVRAADGAGNTSLPITRAFTVDTVAPIAHFVSGPSGTITTGSATFGFSATGHAVGFECSLDGAGFDACSSPATVGSLQNGPHTYAVRAIDAAGNRSAPVSRSFTVNAGQRDTTPPTVTIGSAPAPLSSDATPTFAFSSEAGATFACRVDGGVYETCSSPVTIPPLADGSHSFDVRATDGAGNVGEPASRTFSIDTRAPQTHIERPHRKRTRNESPRFRFAATDVAPAGETAKRSPGASFQCRIDRRAWHHCASPFAPRRLRPGPHRLRVTAIDAAGNRDRTPARFRIVILRPR